MIRDQLFQVIFTTPEGEEKIPEGWECFESMGYPYYEARLGDLHFAVQRNRNNMWYLKVTNRGSVPVTGFAGIRFPWKHGETCYTLIPGIYYDGNYHAYQKNIPVIHMPEKPRFAASVSAATYPAVLAKEGSIGWHYGFSPTSLAGWNGITLDAEEHSLTIYVPAREQEKLQDVTEKAGSDMANYIGVLYSTIFELSRSYQSQRNETGIQPNCELQA